MKKATAAKIFAYVEKELNEGRPNISGKSERLPDGNIKLSLKSATGASLDLVITVTNIEEVKVAKPTM